MWKISDFQWRIITYAGPVTELSCVLKSPNKHQTIFDITLFDIISYLAKEFNRQGFSIIMSRFFAFVEMSIIRTLTISDKWLKLFFEYPCLWILFSNIMRPLSEILLVLSLVEKWIYATLHSVNRFSLLHNYVRRLYRNQLKNCMYTFRASRQPRPDWFQLLSATVYYHLYIIRKSDD